MHTIPTKPPKELITQNPNPVSSPEPSKQKELQFEFPNEIITTCTAGKLRLGYPESIIPEEIPF